MYVVFNTFGSSEPLRNQDGLWMWCGVTAWEPRVTMSKPGKVNRITQMNLPIVRVKSCLEISKTDIIQ